MPSNENDLTSASTETEHGESPDENDIPPQTESLEIDNGFMTTEESAIIQNLEAAIQEPSSNRLSLKDATNVLNLERIKLPSATSSTEGVDKENEAYAQFQLTPTNCETNKTSSGQNKRKSPETETEAPIPKKRGRKSGSKNKKTIEREAKEAEIKSKEKENSRK
jgi:hypothetical protein